MWRQNDGGIIKELNQLQVMFLFSCILHLFDNTSMNMMLVIPDIYLTRFFTVCLLFRILFLSLQESNVCSRVPEKQTDVPVFFVTAFFKKQLLFVCFFSNTLFCVSYWDKFISLHIIGFLWVGVFAAVFAFIISSGTKNKQRYKNITARWRNPVTPGSVYI